MFTQPISMDCTFEQYQKFLKEPLKEMGYKADNLSWPENGSTLVTAFCDINDLLSTFRLGYSGTGRHYHGPFNAPLFLALAAMTDKEYGIVGEHWTCITECSYFTEGKSYKCVSFHYDKSPLFIDNHGDINGVIAEALYKYFRKSTLEEIKALYAEKSEVKEKVSYYAVNTNPAIYVNGSAEIKIKTTQSDDELISLLKSRGYKVYKQKTEWEEV